MVRIRAAMTILALCLGWIVTTQPVPAQMVYGSIFGTVTDATGAVVPGARVKISDINKGTVFEAETNADGNYTRGQLIPGTYKVEVEAEGFSKAVVPEVVASVDTAKRVDVALEVGNVSEQIEVVAESPLLKTDRADVSTNFDSQQLNNLPNLGRNFQSYMLLAPGSQKLQWQHASSENPQGSVQIQNNGMHFSGTGYQLDGTDNQDPILGIIVINPTIESVGEAKITTQNYDAEFGLATAGVVSTSTKSGSNEFHGSVFEYLRNNSPGFQTFARNSFNPAENRGTPPVKWNQFGGSLGGPIVRNKLFFFSDYQGSRQRTGSSLLTVVPTPRARQGDFGEFLEDLPNAPLVQTVGGAMVPLQRNMVFDPLTGNSVTGDGRRAFDNNIIPQARLSQQATALMNRLPQPNTLDASGATFRRNFSTQGTEKLDSDQFNTRVDWFTNDTTSVFGRYSFADFTKTAPSAFGELGGPDLDNVGFAGVSDVRNQSLALGVTKTWSPTLVGEFRFGYMRYRVDVLPGDFGTSPATDLGMPGLNLGDDFTSGLPAFFINIGEGTDDAQKMRFGSALGVNRCNCPLKQEEQQGQFVFNISKIQGNHTLKFGGDLRFAYNLRVPSDKHRSGELSFDPGYTGFVSGAQTLQGLGLATFALGQATSFGRFVSPNTDARERQKRFFWYAQDNWRLTPKLTLNYGIRWEQVFPETVNEPGNGGQLDLRTGEIAVFGVGDVSDHGIQDMKWTNFAPRLGITYQITPKTVIRAGYGWSYSLGTFGSIFGHNVSQNLPVLAIQDLTRPNDFSGVFSLDKGPRAPTFPEPNSSGRFPLPDGVSGKARPDNLRMPRVMSYNATIQHQLTPTFSIEGAYVGNVGRHVFTGDGPDFNVNEPAFIPGVQDTNIRRPFFSRFGWTQGISYYCNCATSTYDSAQIKVVKQLSSGYQLLAHYVGSRTRQDAGAFEFLYDRPLGRGAPDWDHEHVVTVAQNWDVPIGRGRRFASGIPGVLDAFIGGWQLNGVTSWTSGRPFNVTFDNPDPTQFIRPNAGPGDRPDAGTVSATEGVDQNRERWYNPGLGQAFLIPANNQFGNFGRNVLRGPGFFQQDLAVNKQFHMTERVNLQLRAEFFNLFNTVNLALPNGNVTSGDAGRITALADGSLMRRMQFGLRLGF